MSKPQMQPPRTIEQKNAEPEHVTADETGAVPAQVFGVVTPDGRCPTCGKVVIDVNAEPLDYEELPDGTLRVESVVFVVLPCGHDFTRRVEVTD